MQVKAKKKREEKKPQKAMDAGARGRRLLQRREYRAKVSEFIPKELEDHVVYEGDPNTNLFPPGTQQKVKKVLDAGSNFMKNNRVGRVLGRVFGSSRPGSNYTPGGKVTAEANSAQMKAMHDAQIKKKEDDKVAAKKKNVKEGSAYGITRGSGKPSGAFKDYLDKKKKEKTKKEEVELEAKKSCGEGEYYCYDDQKCKSIPEGMKVGKDGMLVKEQQLIEYSPNVSYQAKGGKKSGKLGKSSVYSLRGKKESKKDFRKSHTKDIKDGLVEDMKGMSQKSGDKRSTESGAGMTAKGVAKYNRRTGGNLKTAVTTPPSKLKAGSKAAKRRKSFCARSKSWDGPRGKAARRRWNCSYEPELPMIIDEKKKLFNTAPLSNRVTNWSKKINEGDTYVKSNRNPLTGLPNLGKGDKKKTSDTKVTGVNYSALAQSYEPQGQVVQEMPTDIKNVVKGGLSSARDQFLDKGKVDVKGTLKNTLKNALQTKTVTDFLKKEAYGDVPFRDGRVKKYLGKDNINNIKLTQKGKQAFKTIPDPKIFSGNKAINPDNPITNMYRSLDRVNSSYEPQGEMTEAKYEKGASTYGKASIRNKRMFGKGGNAAPPEERGAAIKVRKARHQERRYVKKGNKYHEPGKHRPEVHGVNKPEEERKGKNIKEGSLHKWFKGSKSKDGKPGWVNVVTGGTCASDKKGEGTPKCVSSSKRASMSKSERLSASRRKKKADPGQQSKSGAAKPTYVATDKKKKVDEMNQGPSTPVGNYDGKIMPKFGAGRIGNVRLKGGKSIADLLKKP